MSTPREYYLRLPKDFRYPTDLLQRVYDQQVVLEHIFTRGITAYGTVRVTNRSFDKEVFVRYTIDRWITSSIINAYYSMHYFDNNTDVFLFKLTVPREKLSLPMNLSFAIGYHANDEEFWDNNSSQNYTLDIKESSILNQLSSEDSFLHKQIALDYHAIPDTFQQTGNLCGLKSLGGTCYMNSVLQSLSFTSSLTYYLFSNEYTKDRSIKNGIVGNEYLNLLSLLCSGKYRVVTPAPFKQIIGDVEDTYFGNQQHDAHEFLVFLLDILHQDLMRIKSSENHSIITDLFYGTYRSTTTCLICKKESSNFEQFICLSLPIPSTNECKLEDCLTYLNEEEYLTDDSKWFCPSCQSLCNAKRRLEIFKLPKILIIQLKRFQIDFEMKCSKNDVFVHYPVDNLCLHEHSSSQSLFYTLYSVINHHGSLDDGHYTTFARDISLNSQLWFEFDDEIINHLSTDQLNQNSKAYLLFYISKQTS